MQGNGVLSELAGTKGAGTKTSADGLMDYNLLLLVVRQPSSSRPVWETVDRPAFLKGESKQKEASGTPLIGVEDSIITNAFLNAPNPCIAIWASSKIAPSTICTICSFRQCVRLKALDMKLHSNSTQPADQV